MRSPWTRDQTDVPCIAGRILNPWATREASIFFYTYAGWSLLNRNLWLMGCDSQQRKSKPQTSPLYQRASGEFETVTSWRSRTRVYSITIRGFTALYYWSRERNETVQLKGHVVNWKWKCESPSVLFDSLWPRGLYSPWNSPGQNTGVASLSLLQGIFPTQGSNPGLPHCRRILYQLSHKVNWRVDE